MLAECAPGFLDDVYDDESALLPLTGVVITMEDVEVRKEGALLELTEPLREAVGHS